MIQAGMTPRSPERRQPTAAFRWCSHDRPASAP